MKIGIVTFWKSNDNYGQILQAFALYKYFESRGHECFIVKYAEENNSTLISKIFTGLRIIKNPIAFIKLKTTQKKGQHTKSTTDRHFNEFRNTWLRFSKLYSNKELKHNVPNAEVFVCGSDQIWGGLDSIMYLSFVPKYCKKIAFAPSFGGLAPNKYVRCKIKKYLKTFDFISCRENSGVELCKSLGRNDAILFPDPTLMHRLDFYNSIIPDNVHWRSPYIFVYMLGNQTDFNIDEIYNFANKNNLQVLYVTGQNGVPSKQGSYPATIEEWLCGIKNAEYVITNSFHGTVFSLIYHKKFMTIPLSGIHSRMNIRICELLERCKLNERIYRGNLDKVKNNIDYSFFERIQLDDIDKVNNALNEIM